jgi:hypothetical protein
MSSPALCAVAHCSGRSVIPETAVLEPVGRGVPHPPHARGMTAKPSKGGQRRACAVPTILQQSRPEWCARLRLCALKHRRWGRLAHPTCESHARTTAASTTTTTISGILVCIIFGCAGRVGRGSWIARLHAAGVDTPRSVAGDTRRVLLGDSMMLARCFARYILGKRGGSRADENDGRKRDNRCPHFSSSLV